MAEEKAKVIDKTENKINSVKSDVPKIKMTADTIKENLMLLPKRTAKAFESLESVKNAFCLPITMSGLSKDDRDSLNMAFDSAGGFSTIYESLTQHAYDLICGLWCFTTDCTARLNSCVCSDCIRRYFKKMDQVNWV